MTTITFDTHKFIQALKASGVPEKQAEAISEAVKNAQSAIGIATQGDVALLRFSIKRSLRRFAAAGSPRCAAPRRTHCTVLSLLARQWGQVPSTAFAFPS